MVTLQKNMSEAFKFALKACDLGNMEACVNVSMMYRRGEGTDKDEALGKKYADVAREMLAQLRGERPQLKFGE
jgi:cytochrome c oxidase assembly factor 7